MNAHTKLQAPTKSSAAHYKARLDLLPWPAMIATSVALAAGAEIYGPFDWRERGATASTQIAAALRHIARWQDGEVCDDDSNAHHLGAAIAALSIIIDAQAAGTLVDDRSGFIHASDVLEHAQDMNRARVLRREARAGRAV